MSHSEETKKKISETLKRSGIAPINRFNKKSVEHRKKLGESHIGQKSWNKGTNLSGMKGKKHSKETKKIMSERAVGRKMSEESKRKLSKSKTGIKQSYKSRKKKSIRAQGIKEKEWNGFKYSKNERLRHSNKWKEWREFVFERDGYICQECGNFGGELHPHHIKPLVNYPELVFDVTNGITMCKDCHMKLHGLQRRKK